MFRLIASVTTQDAGTVAHVWITEYTTTRLLALRERLFTKRKEDDSDLHSLVVLDRDYEVWWGTGTYVSVPVGAWHLATENFDCGVIPRANSTSRSIEVNLNGVIFHLVLRDDEYASPLLPWDKISDAHTNGLNRLGLFPTATITEPASRKKANQERDERHTIIWSGDSIEQTELLFETYDKAIACVKENLSRKNPLFDLDDDFVYIVGSDRVLREVTRASLGLPETPPDEEDEEEDEYEQANDEMEQQYNQGYADGRASVTPAEPPLMSYHFSVGDSTNGPLGLCARIMARSQKEAVENLRAALPSENTLELERGTSWDGVEYLHVYFNPECITSSDIDDSNVVGKEGFTLMPTNAERLESEKALVGGYFRRALEGVVQRMQADAEIEKIVGEIDGFNAALEEAAVMVKGSTVTVKDMPDDEVVQIMRHLLCNPEQIRRNNGDAN